MKIEKQLFIISSSGLNVSERAGTLITLFVLVFCFFSSRGDGFTIIGWETNSSFSTFCERFCKAPVKYSWKPLTLLAILSDCPLKFKSISFSNSSFFVSNSFISLTKESFFETRSLKISLEISSKDFVDLTFFGAIFLFWVVFFLLIWLVLPSEIDLFGIDSFSGWLFEISVLVI